MLSKVLYILEKDNNIDYSLSTHSDIEKISFYTNEKEVLFYPFSSFEIKDITQKKLKGEIIYEIKLLYLGKYLKEIEKNSFIFQNENILPNSEFKNQIIKCGLIEPKKIINNNTKKLFNDYKKFQKEINYNILKKNINNINSSILDIQKYKVNLIGQKFDKDDKIMDLFFRLYNKGLVSDLIIIKHKGEIKAKKFIISQKYLKKNYQMSKYWIEAWHGTKLEYLESIIQYGLKKPGTELSNASMTPQPKFELIDKNGEIDGIKNCQMQFLLLLEYYALQILIIQKELKSKTKFGVVY